MEDINKYPIYEVTGRGRIHLHTGDQGEKFKIVKMSAELLHVKTTAKIEVADIITLKAQIQNGMFLVNVNAIGKIIDKSDLNREFNYTIEFVGMQESDKAEIDQLIKALN